MRVEDRKSEKSEKMLLRELKVLHVPSATMAALATDELVEIEMEENVQVAENISPGVLKGGASTRSEA